MPFSDDLRNELAAVAPRKECDRLAELSGLFHAAGSVHLRGRGEVAVHLDLGLMHRLRLVEHRRGVHGRAPRAGEELGGAEEDRGAVLPRHARPVVPGLARGVDRLLDVLRAALVDVGEHVVLVVRHDRFERVAGADLLAADHERDLDPLGLHLREPHPQLLALGRSRRVVPDRLVHRLGQPEDAVGGHTPRF